jgi:hypothetical protein
MNYSSKYLNKKINKHASKPCLILPKNNSKHIALHYKNYNSSNKSPRNCDANGSVIRIADNKRTEWLLNQQQQLKQQLVDLEEQEKQHQQLLAQREQQQQQLDACVVIEKCAHALHDYAQKMQQQQQIHQQRQSLFDGQSTQTVEQKLKQTLQNAQNLLEISKLQYQETLQKQQHTQQAATSAQQQIDSLSNSLNASSK